MYVLKNVQDAVAQWDYEQLENNFQSFREFESRRERKNLFMRYSQINFCLDTKIYLASSTLASTEIQLFGGGTSLAVLRIQYTSSTELQLLLSWLWC